MYYRKELPVMSAVYRSLPSRRFLVTALGGHWPVMEKLQNGHLGVVTRDGDFHIGERGRLVFVTSPDKGESWSHARVISDEGPDNRNPAFGVASDGTLIASFIRQVNYTKGDYDWDTHISGDRDPNILYVSLSTDQGTTWTTSPAQVDGQDSWGVGSPFGKIITLDDGASLMSYYTVEGRTGTPYTIRSHDGGRTWIDPVIIVSEGYSETSICNLGEGHLLALMRGNQGGGLFQVESTDNGYNWSEPCRITGPSEHPGDVIKLQDERLLMTYGRRVNPFGTLGMVSNDNGKTWDRDNRILLTADSGGGDHGYPSNVQCDDGTIITVYYSAELEIKRSPRQEILGLHGAAVIYRPEDL